MKRLKEISIETTDFSSHAKIPLESDLCKHVNVTCAKHQSQDSFWF